MSAQAAPSKRSGWGLHPTIIAAGWVSFFTDFSSQMVVPVLPLFLIVVLKAPVLTLGVIEGLGAAMAGILRLLSGWLSDRMGHRKPLMVAGYGLSNLIKPAFALAPGWGTVLALRLGDRVGKGLRSAPRDALLADVTTAQERGKAFGFRRSMDLLGAALGPLAAAGILLWSHNAYRLVFFATLLPGLAALVVALVMLKDARRPVTDTHRVLPRINLLALPRPFQRYTLTLTVFALANFSEGFIILRERSLGLAPALIPVAYFVMNAVASLLSMPAGMVADRVGRRRVLVLGFLLLSGTYWGLGWIRSAGWIWPLLALYGVTVALVEGNQKVYAAELIGPEQRGTALGTFNAITGVAGLPAALGAGLLWQAWGPRAPFLAGALVAMTAVFLLLVLVPASRGRRAASA